MDKEIIWHPEAQEDYRDILDYLLDNWSFDVADKFTTQLDDSLQLLKKHPMLEMRIGRIRTVRKISLPPHYSLCYIYINNQVIVLNKLDNRMASDI